MVNENDLGNSYLRFTLSVITFSILEIIFRGNLLPSAGNLRSSLVEQTIGQPIQNGSTESVMTSFPYALQLGMLEALLS